MGPIGVLTATRIDGEFNLVDLDTRDISAQGIGVTNLQVSGITTGLNVSGIITAQNGINFNGTSTGLNVSGLTTVADLTATTISIGGTLTYEDVTSVDSVGVVTARGLSIFGNTTGLQVASGISTFQAVTGTTGTFTGAVNGVSARFLSSTNPQIISENSSGGVGIRLKCDNGSAGTLSFSDAAADNQGMILYHHAFDRMQFSTNGSERIRILSDGKVGINTISPAQQFTSYAASGYPVLANGPSNGIGLGGNGVIVFGTFNLAAYAPGAIDASTFAIKTSGTERLTLTSGGTFGIKCPKYIMLYKYREVDKHIISKIDKK